ncbi:DNA polymerase II subunit B3-1 [Lotus japonicus]|uniref:DNA polymerase II subunit B3-1 n=1 Tax=Lotus japonicus TaxID=34305 RepID=UPI0025876D3F|nr:DNA polymerase II subunit B3-1 [Lotus japonicus]
MASSNNSKSQNNKKIKTEKERAIIDKKNKKPKKEKEEESKITKNKKLKLTNGNGNGNSKKHHRQQEQKHEEEDEEEDIEEAKSHVFPMNRIRTMIKGEDPEARVSTEAILAINKAAEKFLEQFTQEAYTRAVQDRKKSLSYNHLAHVVSKQRRYDFLSDFVPEKVRAEDALREISSRGNGGG